MLPEILKQFNASLKKGLVDPGPRGELVSRIILAVVAHNLKKKGSENSVRNFLIELYISDSIPNLEGFSQEFLEGTVTFTHFNSIDYVPERNDLELFYTRRCAFIMKRNHPGADICIPVRMTNSYSIIIIQIKNINTSTKADKKYPASAESLLDCQYVFADSDLKDHNKPILGLYWQLGYNYHYQETPSTVSTRSKSSNPSNNFNWATFGITHYKISSSILDILKDILTSYISPFDFEWQVDNEEEGDIWDENEIKILHPLRYRKSQ